MVVHSSSPVFDYLDQSTYWHDQAGQSLAIDGQMDARYRTNCQRWLERRADIWCLRYQIEVAYLDPPEDVMSAMGHESLDAVAWMRSTTLYRALGGEPL